MLAIAPGWELEVDRGPGWLLAKLKSGDVNASDTPPLADELWSMLERHFVYRVVLDLDEIELLHSYLLGQLVLLDKRVREHGGMMRLCGLSSFNQRVLRLHGLDVRFPTYGDLEEAVMGFSRKPR
ncbi:MAG: hypothetical protein A2V98_01345 [Planctomycetes bacterium RBG_16_64_12]|nr:MAG: hypothetical protein A2V98_01345 [Planctomycetes bacterium RBG_16_64_12]